MLLQKLFVKAIIAVALLGFVWSPAFGERDGTVWLMKINDAARDLSYSGIFVYVDGNRIDTMRVAHRVETGSIRARMYALNGAPREIIRDGDQVWCYAPDKNLGIYAYRRPSTRGFPGFLPRGLDHVAEYYSVSLGSDGRIADRPARQIRIVPKDELRYGYDLWADKKTGLLLKAALLNQERRPIEQYLFTQIEIGGSIPVAQLDPVTPKTRLVWYGDPPSDSVDDRDGDEIRSNWTVGELPAGFMLTRTIKRLSTIRATEVEHYVYTDGLATVSVFVEQIGEDSLPWLKGVHEMGAVHALGRRLDGYQIIVIGEIPARTVERIGMSVRPK